MIDDQMEGDVKVNIWRANAKKWFDNLTILEKSGVVYMGAIVYVIIVAIIIYHMLKAT